MVVSQITQCLHEKESNISLIAWTLLCSVWLILFTLWPYLSEPRKRGVALAVDHFVRSVEQPKNGFAVIDARQEYHEAYIDGDHVEVQPRRVKVVRYVQRDLAGVESGKKLRNVVPVVE